MSQRRIALTGALLVALALLATLVFVLAWALGSSAQLLERASAVPPRTPVSTIQPLRSTAALPSRAAPAEAPVIVSW